MGWTVVIVLGCVVGAVGLFEALTNRLIIPRPGHRPTPRADGWALAAIGATMIVIALVLLLDLPSWLLFAIVVLGVVLVVWLLVAYRPAPSDGSASREAPRDPGGVYRREGPPR